MTNCEKIISEITAEEIAEYMRIIYCADGECEECPIYSTCNIIFDKLGGEKKVKSSKDIILHWLNDYKDYVFYSHDSGNKKKSKNDYGAKYKFRCRCSICGQQINTYGLASIGIAGANGGYRLLGKVCEDCFPKLCKVLKISAPNFKEPTFREKKHISTDKTYCADCGKASPHSYNFCPKCGTALDK